MRFGLKFVSIASIAGVLAWAASAAPLQARGEGQGSGYGYGGAQVTLCHIPPGNPDNAHTITVGASAVPAHLAHGDTLGPCPQAAPATGGASSKTPKKSKDTEESATEGTSGFKTPTAESATAQESAAPAQQQDQKKPKPKKEKPPQSNGVGHVSAPTTATTTEVSSPGNGNEIGGDNGNGQGNGNGNGNGKNK